MIYENLFALECKPDGYQPPRTVRTAVEAESSFCDVTVDSSANVKSSDNSFVVVEEYSTIENDVTFN